MSGFDPALMLAHLLLFQVTASLQRNKGHKRNFYLLEEVLGELDYLGIGKKHALQAGGIVFNPRHL